MALMKFHSLASNHFIIALPASSVPRGSQGIRGAQSAWHYKFDFLFKPQIVKLICICSQHHRGNLFRTVKIDLITVYHFRKGNCKCLPCSMRSDRCTHFPTKTGAECRRIAPVNYFFRKLRKPIFQYHRQLFGCPDQGD